MDGLLVSLLGIDGIGKSTLARAFADQLRASGVEVVDGSWRAALVGSDDPWPRQSLQQLWLETFRCLYGGALRDGDRVPLPRDYPDWVAGGHEALLAEGKVGDNSAAGALASALVELAGNVILAAEVIAPARRRGAVVIQETFPLKHVLKEVLIADRLIGPDSPAGLADTVARLTGQLEGYFGSALLHPDVGILVDGPTELAYRWRQDQAGGLGAVEDFGAAGERGWESYRLLQRLSADAFRTFAGRHGWLVHRVDDAGLAANLERGLALLSAHPAIVALTSRAAVGRAGSAP